MLSSLITLKSLCFRTPSFLAASITDIRLSFIALVQAPRMITSARGGRKIGTTDCFCQHNKLALLFQYYLTPILQAAYRTATLFSSKIGTERRKAGLSSWRRGTPLRDYSNRFLDRARNDEFEGWHSPARATGYHSVAFGKAGSSVACRHSSSLPYRSLPVLPDGFGAVGLYHLGDLCGGAVIVDLELFGRVCPA
jgi:hypothetical protein